MQKASVEPNWHAFQNVAISRLSICVYVLLPIAILTDCSSLELLVYTRVHPRMAYVQIVLFPLTSKTGARSKRVTISGLAIPMELVDTTSRLVAARNATKQVH
jgi:hypothetical protein